MEGFYCQVVDSHWNGQHSEDPQSSALLWGSFPSVTASRVHDHFAWPSLGLGSSSPSVKGGYSLHGVGASFSIRIQTGQAHTFEGSRHLGDGNSNLPDACRSVSDMHSRQFFPM